MLSRSLRQAAAATAVCLLAGSISAQVQPGVAVAPTDAQRVQLAEALDVGDMTVQSLSIPTEPGLLLELDLVLDGQPHTLLLRPHSVRGDNFRLLMDDGSGELVEVTPAATRTWRGIVVDVPTSHVAATLADGKLTAVITLAPGLPRWGVHPADDVLPGFLPQQHVIYTEADGIDRGYHCGGAVSLGGTSGSSGSGTPGGSGSGGGGYAGGVGNKVCEIACDADVEFYNKNFASVTLTELDIESVLNVVEAIYEADVGITYSLGTVIVRTSNPDPYTSSAPGTLLNQFRSEWNNNQSGIQRDIAHLFTGRNIDNNVIGIAWLSVICSGSSGYGLSQSKYAPAMANRAALTAHELGHNWSAGHCDSQAQCAIMCSGLGGCGGNITSFGPNSIASITNMKNSVSGCLGNSGPAPAPTLLSVSPASVGPLGGEVITLTGDDFYESDTIFVGGVTLLLANVDYFIINDATITFVSPAPTGLGPVSVVVSGDGGNSSSHSYTITVASPPIFNAPILIAPYNQPSASWTFAGSPNGLAFFLFDLDGGTFSFQGYSVLQTVFPIFNVPMNGAGAGVLTIPLDPSMSIGSLYNVFTQMVFFDPTIYHSSLIAATLVF
jgi:uncharacterized membrane protein YgcG